MRRMQNTRKKRIMKNHGQPLFEKFATMAVHDLVEISIGAFRK
jgi:hypothetical protein